VESNPVAQWVLVRWGIQGLAVFKLAMTAVVVVIAEFIGKTRPQTARLLLTGGI
jgi:Mg2+/Co2+ transporter CorB